MRISAKLGRLTRERGPKHLNFPKWDKATTTDTPQLLRFIGMGDG